MLRQVYTSNLSLQGLLHLGAVKTLKLNTIIGLIGLSVGISLLSSLPANATSFTLQQGLNFSNEQTYERFGFSASVDQNYAILSTPYDNSNAGSAYVYDLTSNGVRKLTPNDPLAGGSGYFGNSSAVSGNYGLIGAQYQGTNYAGAAYVFDLNTGSQLRKLTPSDSASGDLFGENVALSGNYALVGARHNTSNGVYRSGAAYVFDINTGQQIRKLVASDGAKSAYFGQSVSVNGNYAVVGSRNTNGSAYIFDITTGQQWKLTAPSGANFFGVSVSVSGNYALVGASGENSNQGAAYLYNLTTRQLVSRLTADIPTASSLFGSSVSLRGNYALIGASGTNTSTGAAYLFDISGSLPSLVQKLTAPTGVAYDSFGNSVSLGNNQILIGANGVNSYTGAGYLYSPPVPVSPTLQLASLQAPLVSPTLQLASLQATTAAPVPEPLTILGSATAVAFGIGFKKKLGQKKGPKDENP